MFSTKSATSSSLPIVLIVTSNGLTNDAYFQSCQLMFHHLNYDLIINELNLSTELREV